MANAKKELEKKMLIKKTVNMMNKQIQKLEVYIEAGKQAKQRGLSAQYNLALSGLKMTLVQQKRVYEMKLNFEITSQMKDMTQMTSQFLQGMSSLSKDMMKITKEKDFLKVQSQFNEAMMGVEMQTEQIENFMAFSTVSSGGSAAEDKELEAIFANAAADDAVENMIDKELAELKKKIDSGI